MRLLLAFLLLSLSAFAADRQVINVGTLPNDGTGDSQRTAWQKANANFETLFSGTPTVADPGAFRGAIGALSQTESVDSLRLLGASSRTNGVLVLGRYSAGDGGGGVFYWSLDSTATDDNGITIQPTGVTTGRWIRAVTSPANVLWFGAVADGSTDNSIPIQTAINYVSAQTNGGTLLFPAGKYSIGTTLTVTNTMKEVWLRGQASFGGLNTSDGAVLILANAANCDMLVKPIGSRVNIANLYFDGNKANQTSTNLNGLWIQGNSGVIARCTFEDLAVKNVSGVGVRNDNRESRFYRIAVDWCTSHGIVDTSSSDTPFEDIASGFNGGAGMYWEGKSYSRFLRGDLYRNQWGLVMTNCSVNQLIQIQCDANMKEGLIVSSSPSSASFRNNFLGCNFIVNNYQYDNNFTTPTPSTVPNGTYSNANIVGTNTVDINFKDCAFWAYETTLTNRPKYQLEDSRGGVFAAAPYGRMSLYGCYFTENGSSVLQPYITGLQQNAECDFMLDTTPVYSSRRTLDTVRVQDQLEAESGLQANAFYDGAWKYRVNGPAYYLSARYDDPVLTLKYAASGIASNAITWTTALNVNTTNGYVAIGTGSIPAVVPLEVTGAGKFDFLDSHDGMSANAYYSAGWKRRTTGPAYFYQNAANGVDDFVFSVTPTSTAGSAITWAPAFRVGTNGITSFSGGVTIDNGSDGLRLNGGTASTLIQLDGTKHVVSIANSTGALINNGSGAFTFVPGITQTNTWTATGTNWTQVITSGVITSMTHSP